MREKKRMMWYQKNRLKCKISKLTKKNSEIKQKTNKPIEMEYKWVDTERKVTREKKRKMGDQKYDGNGKYQSWKERRVTREKNGKTWHRTTKEIKIRRKVKKENYLKKENLRQKILELLFEAHWFEGLYGLWICLLWFESLAYGSGKNTSGYILVWGSI